MISFLLIPERDTYSVDADYGVVTTNTEGGMPRQRRDRLSTLFKINVTYLCVEEEFEYAMRFLRAVAGTEFKAPLVLDSSKIDLYKVRLISSVNVTELSPLVHKIQFSLIATGKPYNINEDSGYAYMLSLKHTNFSSYLEKLTNVDLYQGLRNYR
jgi:hypothetical protein|nr:MAG TPA: hypothetical protein [Caudoviricetes sp.]